MKKLLSTSHQMKADKNDEIIKEHVDVCEVKLNSEIDDKNVRLKNERNSVTAVVGENWRLIVGPLM
jgi:predicted RNA-binding protein with PUA-like domain